MAHAAVAFAGLAGLVAATALGARLSVEKPTLCRDGAAQFATVWNDAGRGRVRASLPAHGALVVQMLDAYQGSWTTMHREACEATRVLGHQSEDAMALRMTCLSGRLEDARALIAVLGSGATPPERARPAVESLAPVAGCADLAELAAPVRPPADPAVRALVEKMDPENIEVGELSAGLGQTLSRAGDHDGALAAFARALPILEAELGADHADVAEAHGHHAEALLAARRWREAAAEADRALTRGRAGRGPK